MKEYDLPQPEELGLPAPETQRPPQQEQFAPPGLLEPYSQADDMQLQRLQAGLASVRQQVWDGDLHEQEGDAYQRQIIQQAVPLAARKKKAQDMARQQQLEEALHTSAMAKAVEQQNATYDAHGFGSRASYIRNPQTGQMAMFYQKRPGEFEPVDFGDQPDPYAASAEGQGGVFVDSPDDQQQPASADDEGAESSPDSEPAEGEGGTEPQAARPAAPVGRGEPLTIYNGNERSVYRDGRLIEHTDASGNPLMGPGQNADSRFGLNKETLDFVHHIATAGSMHLPPGVQRNAMYSHLYQRGIMQAVQEAAITKRQAGQVEQQQRAEQFKTDRAEAKSLEDERTKLRSTIAKEVHDEYVTGKKEDDLAENLSTPAGRAAEVDARMKEIWGNTHPDIPHNRPITPDTLKKGGEKGTAKADSSAEPAAEPRPVPSTPAGARAARNELASLASKVYKNDPGAKLSSLLTHMQTEVSKDTRPIQGVVTDPTTGNTFSGAGGGNYAALPHGAQRAVAEQRAMEHLSSLTGKKPAAQPAAPAATPGTPPSPQATPLPPHVFTPEEIKADLARRAKEGQGPGLIPRVLNTPREPGFRQ